LLFGQEIEQMITLRDIEGISSQWARIRARAKQLKGVPSSVLAKSGHDQAKRTSMKPWWGLPQAGVQTSFIVVAESLVIMGIAYARDEPPPSPVRPWAPPALPRYEGELRQYKPTEAERRYYPIIDPLKTYNLAELIDIAQRTNPETRVAWERARMAAAAVGLTESAYYPYIVAAAVGGYDRAFI